MSGQETPTRGQGRAVIYSMSGKLKETSAMNSNFNYGALLLQARVCQQPAAVKVGEGCRTRLRARGWQLPTYHAQVGICTPKLRLLQ